MGRKREMGTTDGDLKLSRLPQDCAGVPVHLRLLRFTNHSIKTGTEEKGLTVCRVKVLLISLVVVCIIFNTNSEVKCLDL